MTVAFAISEFWEFARGRFFSDSGLKSVLLLIVLECHVLLIESLYRMSRKTSAATIAPVIGPAMGIHA